MPHHRLLIAGGRLVNTDCINMVTATDPVGALVLNADPHGVFAKVSKLHRSSDSSGSLRSSRSKW